MRYPVVSAPYLLVQRSSLTSPTVMFRISGFISASPRGFPEATSTRAGLGGMLDDCHTHAATPLLTPSQSSTRISSDVMRVRSCPSSGTRYRPLRERLLPSRLDW